MPDDSQPIIVAIVADLHCNSALGLCPAAVTLDTGGTYRGSKSQRVIYSHWREFWAEQVFAEAKALGAQVYAIFNGDLNDFNVHDGAELISRARADVVKLAVAAIEPALKADRVFIVRGTEAHVGKRANLEEEVAKDIGAEPDTQAGTHSWYWLKLMAGGVTFDIAHHPQTFSRRPWTIDAAASRHGRIVREEYLDRGERPPDVAIRSHVHKFVPSNRRLKPFFCYSPGWQIVTAFGHRLGATAFEPVGGLVFVCQDGRYTFEPVLYRLPGLRRKAWKAK